MSPAFSDCSTLDPSRGPPRVGSRHSAGAKASNAAEMPNRRVPEPQLTIARSQAGIGLLFFAA